MAQLLTRNIVDELIVTPAGAPWMRVVTPVAAGEDRLEMVKLAVATLPGDIAARIKVSDSEIQRAGATFTIDTVLEVKAENPNAQLVLIIGSDAFSTIGQWHRSEELLGLVEVFVVAREGVGFDIDALSISSSSIREKIESNEDFGSELPESVWSYIKERNLYASK